METLLLMVVLAGIEYIPIVGAVALVLSAAVRLGAVLMTQFGTRAYMPATSTISITATTGD